MAISFIWHIAKEASVLTLSRDGEQLGQRHLAEARDMGRTLFSALTELLAEQKLRPQDVDDFLVEGDIPDVYTSARIAETVKNVYTFGVGKIKNK